MEERYFNNNQKKCLFQLPKEQHAALILRAEIMYEHERMAAKKQEEWRRANGVTPLKDDSWYYIMHKSIVRKNADKLANYPQEEILDMVAHEKELRRELATLRGEKLPSQKTHSPVKMHILHNKKEKTA